MANQGIDVEYMPAREMLAYVLAQLSQGALSVKAFTTPPRLHNVRSRLYISTSDQSQDPSDNVSMHWIPDYLSRRYGI